MIRFVHLPLAPVLALALVGAGSTRVAASTHDKTFDDNLANWRLPADWHTVGFPYGWWSRATVKEAPSEDWLNSPFVRAEKLHVSGSESTLEFFPEVSGCPPVNPSETVAIIDPSSASVFDFSESFTQDDWDRLFIEGYASVSPLNGTLFGLEATGRTADIVYRNVPGIERVTEFCVELNGRVLAYSIEAQYETEFGEPLPDVPDSIPPELSEGVPSLVKAEKSDPPSTPESPRPTGPALPLQEDSGQSGLVGKVYPLPKGQSELPNFAEIANQSIGTLVAPNVDVPSQDFRTGFPGVEDRIEWFAIRFEGSLVISAPGDYEFKLLSDDGSRLFIDKKLTVDHDGLQASTTATSEPVALSSGAHDLVLEYFQGPGGGIALQLFWKTPGSSEFVIVPPEAFARPDRNLRDRVQISAAENGTLVYSDERVSTSAMAASLRDATSTLTSPGTYSGGLVTILLLALLGIFLEFPFNWVEARAKGRYLGIMERLRKAAADPRAPRILGIRIDVILFLILGQVIVQLNAPLALIPPIGQLLQTALLSALAIMAISAWYALPRILLQRRAHGDSGEFRAEWPSLFIALLGLAAAQLSGIVPGFLIGLFTVRKFRRALPDGLTARGTFVSTVALVALGLVAWFALDALDATIVEPTDPLRTIGDGLFGVLLVAGSQGALLNLLDPGDEGAMALRRASLAQWLAAVGISGLLAFALLAAGKIDLAIFTPPTTVEHYIALLAFAFVSLGLIVFVDRLTERRVRRRRTTA